MHDDTFQHYLNPENWFSPVSPEAVHYKQMVMSALNTYSNGNNPTTSNGQLDTLMQDIDICAFILTRFLFQYEKEKINDCLDKYHLADLEKARYLFKVRCLDEVATHILEQQPDLFQDESIIRMIFPQRYAFSVAENMLPFIQNKAFVLSVIESCFYPEWIMKYYPKDTELSQILIKRGHYPNSKTKELYDMSVLEDKVFVIEAIAQEGKRSTYSSQLYELLPESLQLDVQVCQSVLKNNPQHKVKLDIIKDMESFKLTHRKHANEYSTLIAEIEKYPLIFNTPENMLQGLLFLCQEGTFTHVEDWDGNEYKEHELQEYLKKLATQYEFINNYIQTVEGQRVLDFKIDGAGSYLQFEEKVIPTIARPLEQAHLAWKLDRNMPDKEDLFRHKNKI